MIWGRVPITTNSRHLEDDACGWGASGIRRRYAPFGSNKQRESIVKCQPRL